MKTYVGYSGWKGWSRREFGACNRSMAAYFRAELARCGLTQLAGCRVLEIGFGNGEFAGWARQQGMDYSGTDMIPALVRLGMSQDFDVHSAEIPLSAIFKAGSLDMVVAFDVFEHISLDDLKAGFGEIRQCLRHGGVLIARVPSGDSPFSRAIQHGDLTHRTLLGSSAIKQLASETGFELLQVREPALPLRGTGVISGLRRAAVQVARRLTFPVIARIFMGGGSPVLTPNMVFVLRKSSPATPQTAPI